jgi:hypothetical protein
MYCAAAPLATTADAFQWVYSHFVNVLTQGTWPQAIDLYFNTVLRRAILLIKEAS